LAFFRERGGFGGLAGATPAVLSSDGGGSGSDGSPSFFNSISS
jgi:hypothetical protein